MSASSPPKLRRVHIIGRKNHGKTTLVVDLVAELSRRGLRVGTIKHTHHAHELDTPGKDSHRHGEAGATAVGILSREMNAVFWRPDQADADRYAAFARMFDQCDVVLVEGDTQTQAAKIEVWRATSGGEPLAKSDHTIAAVVTDDPVEGELRTISRGNVARVADLLVGLTKTESAPIELGSPGAAIRKTPQ